ncbi:hypothetical protein [Rhodococcus sp. IEGM 1408]|uniref:hypothetical protein n=1 Tax=Rhodococcus sp. IEGM 1408 TaxID=3082220 RepID=UPI0029530571|nr:hypothetical protein [Rhodococcus sp. IEGM 1408]MDV8002776.1 hypothetical protein [Rhodococcus sp. IEGM 1408]
MHTVPHSPRPASFHVAVAGSEVRGLFTDAQVATQEPDRPRITSREYWSQARRSNAFGDSSAWGNWLPVATTGWGALFVVAPLLIANFLVWATGAHLRDHHTPDRPGFDDHA